LGKIELWKKTQSILAKHGYQNPAGQFLPVFFEQVAYYGNNTFNDKPTASSLQRLNKNSGE